jgi:hypothetical protein
MPFSLFLILVRPRVAIGRSAHRKRTSVTPALSRTGPYGMNAAFMQPQRHGWDMGAALLE